MTKSQCSNDSSAGFCFPNIVYQRTLITYTEWLKLFSDQIRLFPSFLLTCSQNLIVLSFRQHRHTQRQPETDSWANMVPDRPLSVGCFQLPPEEADAGMAEGSATRLQDQKLHHRLEQWHLSERPS